MGSSTKVTSTLEDYLEAVFVLESEDSGAHVDAIASKVGVHKSTVTAALHSLADKGLVDYRPYRPVRLTREGRRVGGAVRNRHEALQRFLTSVLGVGVDVAAETACRMEHVIPQIVIDRFESFTDFMETCPQMGPRLSEHFRRFQEGRLRPGDCAPCLTTALESLEENAPQTNGPDGLSEGGT